MKKRARRREASAMENEQKNAPETPETEPVTEAQAEAEPQVQAEAPQAPAAEAALAAAKAQAEEYLAMAQRVQADFDNFRRRNEAARADAYADGRRSVAIIFLDALDNLERALAVGEDADPEALRKGVELTWRQMTEAYKKLGVEPIDRAGEPFDPNLENAVLQGTSEDGAPGTVCQVFQKGYRMGDAVLRHAMVKVVPEE